MVLDNNNIHDVSDWMLGDPPAEKRKLKYVLKKYFELSLL